VRGCHVISRHVVDGHELIAGEYAAGRCSRTVDENPCHRYALHPALALHLIGVRWCVACRLFRSLAALAFVLLYCGSDRVAGRRERTHIDCSPNTNHDCNLL